MGRWIMAKREKTRLRIPPWCSRPQDEDGDLHFEDGFESRGNSVASSSELAGSASASRHNSEAASSPSRNGGAARRSQQLPPLSLSGNAANNGHVCEPVPEEREAVEEGRTPTISEGESDPPPGSPRPREWSARALLKPVHSHSAAAATPSGRLGPGDFDILHVVGAGAFGKVFQVRKRSNGAIYAMKVMKKEKIVERNHVEYMRGERRVPAGLASRIQLRPHSMLAPAFCGAMPGQPLRSVGRQR